MTPFANDPQGLRHAAAQLDELRAEASAFAPLRLTSVGSPELVEAYAQFIAESAAAWAEVCIDLEERATELRCHADAVEASANERPSARTAGRRVRG